MENNYCCHILHIHIHIPTHSLLDIEPSLILLPILILEQKLSVASSNQKCLYHLKTCYIYFFSIYQQLLFNYSILVNRLTNAYFTCIWNTVFPQWSVLGPILFNIYMVPLFAIIDTFPNISFHSYTDDILIISVLVLQIILSLVHFFANM